MTPKDLLKEELANKLNDMSKEELVDVIADIVLKTVFSRIFVSSLGSGKEMVETLKSIDAQIQKGTLFEKQQVNSIFFVGKEMLKDSALFAQNCKRENK